MAKSKHLPRSEPQKREQLKAVFQGFQQNCEAMRELFKELQTENKG